VWVTAPS